MQNNDSLSRMLREARPEYSLPPGFQEAVWRRIPESRMSPVQVSNHWLEILADWWLRPRFALMLVAVIVALGIFSGIIEGAKAARQEARERYLTAVVPREVR